MRVRRQGHYSGPVTESRTGLAHEDSRNVLGQVLMSLGATVVLAETSRQALAIATREPPELVRVVALTGCGAELDIERTHAAGLDAHLVKPLDHELLVAAVARVLGQTAAS